MMGSILRLFKRQTPTVPEWQKEAEATGLSFRRAQLTPEHLAKGWGNGQPVYTQYYCRKCDGELTPGPSGAGTNQVCEACKLNYGCLPNALER